MLESKVFKESNSFEVHLINFSDYNLEFEKLLDSYLTLICEGTDDQNKLKRVKERIRRYLRGKTDDERKVAGWLSELFCHIYLNTKEFKPAFLFQNLEEQNSMKKGFDGIYVKKKDFFIYESKSTLPTTEIKDHLTNIKIAFKDIEDKIGGRKLDSSKTPIDPWTNAIHHLKNTKITNSKALLKQFDEISNNFFENNFQEIKDFNVIPSSIIYMGNDYLDIETDYVYKRLIDNKEYFNAKSNVIICVNKKEFDYIYNYLNEKD